MAYNSFPIRFVGTKTIPANSSDSFGPIELAETTCLVQATVHGDRPFVAFIEGSPDGVTWFTIERMFSGDLGSDGSPRYGVPLPAGQILSAFRFFRVRVRNSDASNDGSFTVAICAKE